MQVFNIFLTADTSNAIHVLKGVVSPLVYTLGGLASLICAAFLINSGLHYITSSGDPEKLNRSKKIIKESIIGLIIILSAIVLTSILTNAYSSGTHQQAQQLPSLTAIKPASSSLSLIDLLVKAITGILQNVVQSIGHPFISALGYFTSGTSLMAQNSTVFNIWLLVVAMADILFVLTTCLLGFHVMSATTFGIDEIDVKHLAPQLVLTFLLVNSSIFAIDAIITLSNGMINAINSGFGNLNIWSTLSKLSDQSGSMGLAALIIMVVFLVLAFILLVYYVGRLVTLYLGAALSPLVLLVLILPSFQDFATSAIKTYISTIFVLFIHVVILILASSILSTLVKTGSSSSPDPIMSLVVGMSTLIALIKTQGVLMQLNYASIGPRSIRKLSSQFINSFNNSRITTRAN